MCRDYNRFIGSHPNEYDKAIAKLRFAPSVEEAAHRIIHHFHLASHGYMAVHWRRGNYSGDLGLQVLLETLRASPYALGVRRRYELYLATNIYTATDHAGLLAALGPKWRVSTAHLVPTATLGNISLETLSRAEQLICTCSISFEQACGHQCTSTWGKHVVQFRKPTLLHPPGPTNLGCAALKK